MRRSFDSEVDSTTPLFNARAIILDDQGQEEEDADIVVIRGRELDRYDYDSSDQESSADYYRYIEKKICCTKTGCIKGWKVTGITAYGVIFLSVTCIVDGFDLQEFVEFITRKEFAGFALMAPGFVVSALTQTPIFLTIIFNSDRDHDHGHDHSVTETIVEIIVIGGPFTMIGSAAFINFMRKFNANLPLGLKFISVPFALVYGGSQYVFHGFFIHQAEDQLNDQQRFAFFRAAYNTLFRRGWTNFFIKGAIFLGHLGEGLFDGRKFVEEWGIDHFSKTLGFVIVLVVPIGVLIHALSESFAYDQAFNQNNSHYMRTAYGIIFVSGLLHVIPGLTGIAELLLGALNVFFGLDDWLAASLCMVVTIAALGYPNVRGYIGSTIKIFNELFGLMLNKASNYLRHGREADDWVELDRLDRGDEGQANNRHRFNLRDHPLNQGTHATSSRCTLL